MIERLTQASFGPFVQGAGWAVVLLDAPWNTGTLRPQMASAMLAHDRKVRFGEVDVDAEVRIAEELGILNVPAIAYYRDGVLTAIVTGAHQDVRARVEVLIHGDIDSGGGLAPAGRSERVRSGPPGRVHPTLPPGIGLINFTWACVTLTASSIGVCLLSAASDRSELAGAPMSLAVWWLVPLALALGLLTFARVPEARRGAWVLLLVSVLGLVLPFYLALTGTVVSYDIDADVRTLESRHPWAWLAAYGIVSAVLTTLAVRLTRRASPGA